MATGPTSSRSGSLAARYAPFIAIIALQLVLVTITPSDNNNTTTTVTETGAPSSGEFSAGPVDNGQTGTNGNVPAASGGVTVVEVAAKFAAGDAVRARNVHPRGHTRLPRYVRGRMGTIAHVHGVYEIDDQPWEGMEAEAQTLYSVRFELCALWGLGEQVRDAVYVDLWESHLEPA